MRSLESQLEAQREASAKLTRTNKEIKRDSDEELRALREQWDADRGKWRETMKRLKGGIRTEVHLDDEDRGRHVGWGARGVSGVVRGEGAEIGRLRLKVDELMVSPCSLDAECLSGVPTCVRGS